MGEKEKEGGGPHRAAPHISRLGKRKGRGEELPGVVPRLPAFPVLEKEMKKREGAIPPPHLPTMNQAL